VWETSFGLYLPTRPWLPIIFCALPGSPGGDARSTVALRNALSMLFAFPGLQVARSMAIQTVVPMHEVTLSSTATRACHYGERKEGRERWRIQKNWRPPEYWTLEVVICRAVMAPG